MQDVNKLTAARQEAADRAFQNYDFGSEVVVEDSVGWEFSTPGTEWSRTLFVRFKDSAPSADTEVATFCVAFAGEQTAEVAESYTLLRRTGALIGQSSLPQRPAGGGPSAIEEFEIAARTAVISEANRIGEDFDKREDMERRRILALLELAQQPMRPLALIQADRALGGILGGMRLEAVTAHCRALFARGGIDLKDVGTPRGEPLVFRSPGPPRRHLAGPH